MTANVYKGCVTCASGTRKKGGLKCLEGRQASYMGHIMPCWKPKDGKLKTNRGGCNEQPKDENQANMH